MCECVRVCLRFDVLPQFGAVYELMLLSFFFFLSFSLLSVCPSFFLTAVISPNGDS